MTPEELVNHVVRVIKIIIFLLLYLYFFKGNVREFFSLAEQNKWKPILAELGICIGIGAAVSIVAKVMN